MAFDTIQTLLRCELFSNLSQEEIQPIISLCQTENYQPGAAIFQQGDQGSKIYIIQEGQVTLTHSVDLGNREAQVVVALLGPGRSFGCWLALLGETHTMMCSAVCVRKADLLAIEGPVLRKILEKNLPVGFKVMEKLAYILRDRLRGVYGAMEKL